MKASRDEANYQRGARLGERLGGDAFAAVVGQLREIDEELADYLVEHAYGTVMSRPGLSLEDRELSIVAGLAAQGHLPQLRWHLAAALRIGIAAEVLREALVQVIPFAGWPAAMNALFVMGEVFAQAGIALEGLQKTPASPSDRSELADIGRRRGGEVYADYLEIERRISEYDAELPAYLTENAYGQIYARPGLDMRRRELIAVAMLSVLQRLPQLGSHIKGAHRVGCTPSETKEVIVTLLLYSGWPATLNALQVWREQTS